MEALNTQLLRFFDWLLWTTVQGSILIVLIILLQRVLPALLSLGALVDTPDNTLVARK